MNGSHRLLTVTVFNILLLVALSVGCKSYTSPSFLPFSDKSTSESKSEKKQEKEEKIEYGIPTSIAVVWVDSVLTPPGRPSVRGFGGRAFFYNEDGEAVRVDGDFVVYAYNDTNDRLKSNVPDRKYVFRSQELQGHHTDSEFGPCYNFWVPWDQVGGERTTVTLLPQLVLAPDQKVQGMQSVNVLPGKESATDMHPLVEEVSRSTTRIRSPSPTRQVSYDEEENLLEGNNPSTINRTSIKSSRVEIPASVARKMQETQMRIYQQQQRLNAMGSQAQSQEPESTQLNLTPKPINRVIQGPPPSAMSPVTNGGSTSNSANQSNQATRNHAFGVPGPIGPQ